MLQAGLGIGLGFLTLLIARAIPLAVIRRWPHICMVRASSLRRLYLFPASVSMLMAPLAGLILASLPYSRQNSSKLAFVIVLAWWLAPRARQLTGYKNGLLPFSIILLIPTVLLLAQPNTSIALLIIATGISMYFAAGAPWRDFGILALVAVIAFGTVVLVRPYVLERIKTFIDPSANSLGSGYQIQQSLIAIGSGGLLGRGFGQSIEKFNYLPEPDGDSVFAVFAEETGFVGATFSSSFCRAAARGIVIAGNSRELFGGLLALGFSFIIILQAFINMCAMLGIIPLTGLPLPFVSHGGTALMAALIMCGLILNVAAHRKA